MVARFYRSLLLSLFALLVVSRACGQELSFMAGGMTARNAELSSYTWQVDYRQNFSRYVAGSIALINEGHILGHHRDGTTFELWGRLPLLKDRVALSLGAGAYYFYDTQPLADGDTGNIHGIAPIYSFSATAYLGNRWFLKATINRINPTTDIKTNTAAAGLGFWFGRERKPTRGKLGDGPEQYAYVTPNELTVFAGESIVNTLVSETDFAYAAEYRRGILPHLDWTASAVYEGDPRIVRRRGIATQLWAVNTFFHERVSVGAGLGPYFFVDTRQPDLRGKVSNATAAPLVSFSAATMLSEHWLVRVVFDRVTTHYNRDSDILLVGAGYRWGRKAH
jgi:hypothetical protein